MRARRPEVFTTIRTEGAILPSDLLRRVAEGDKAAGGLEPGDYHLAGEKLNEAMSRSWNRLVGAWATFQAAAARHPERDPGTSVTRERWLLPLFQELGYGRLVAAKPIEVEDRSYPISHGWQHAPIHLVGFRVDLDKRTAGVAGAARVSPHGLVQELLNRSPAHMWGFVSNGLRLRVLRDNASLTRQAYVEFDLEAMMRGEVYADFALLWLLCHESRVEAERPEECWLERWSLVARTQGTRALDQLRRGVEEAFKLLGSGFLSHPVNQHLRERLRAGALSPQDYYRQLLRVVYRLLFLFVAEDRGLLLDPLATAEVKARYAAHYSTARLRRIAERIRGTPHGDLWQAVALVMAKLASDDGYAPLGLPPLGSFLWSAEALPDVDGCLLTNRDLLDAVRALAFTDDASGRRPVDYKSLGSEELGSVYEALVEHHAEVNLDAATFALTSGGKERRATGSYYTPTSILNKVLNFALEPAIAKGMKASDPEKALLSLRILDPACGSGHFLIAAAHRVAKRLAFIRTGDEEPPPEARRVALREVVTSCLYGVDVNPMAVELCKIALSLETLDPAKPLGFLDQRIRSGDSLLGVPLTTTIARTRAEIEARRRALQEEVRDVEKRLNNTARGSEEETRLVAKQKELKKALAETTFETWPDHVPDEAFKTCPGDDTKVAGAARKGNKKERKGESASLAFALPADVARDFAALGTGDDRTLADVRAKERRFRAAQATPEYAAAKLRADAWCAAFFWPLRNDTPDPPTDAVLRRLKGGPDALRPEERALIERIADERRFFDFEIAFPEVFAGDRPGFDVVIGNPPYLGGVRISTHHGDKYLNFLKLSAAEASGATDLVAYFFRRGFDLLRDDGNLGLLATNTIAQGDTRAASLGPITERWGGAIANAVRSMPWEGTANLEVAVVHVHKGPWGGRRTLDGGEVATVTPMLDDGSSGSGEPVRLRANADLAFQGSIVLGMGFVLEPDEAQALIARDPRNKDVLFPYLNGEDLNSRSDQSGSRWVINFFDWPRERVSKEEWEAADDEQQKEWEKAGRVAHDYGDPVAADYPEILDIVLSKVKPVRELDNRKAYRDRWWQYAERRRDLRAALAERAFAIAVARTAKYRAYCIVSPDQVLEANLVVFVSEATSVLALLQSSVHEIWVNRTSSTLETRQGYRPSDCFETFPLPLCQPSQSESLGQLGKLCHAHRRAICLHRRLGLTKVYNLFHDPATERDDAPVQKAAPPFDDIRRIRALHIELDKAVLAAYEWDVDLRHGFYQGRDAGTGIADDEHRFTIHPEARKDVLRRLLALNHERAIEEAAMLERGEEIPSAFAAFEAAAEAARSAVEEAVPAALAAVAGPRLRRMTPRPEDRYRTVVPLMTLKAAAGGFGDPAAVEVDSWVAVDTAHRLAPGMFVAPVAGHSMEPKVPDGAYCLFRAPVQGSRQGRFLLVQHRAISDPETGGSYTLKRYESVKEQLPDGSWRHVAIRLHPLNPRYERIELAGVDEGDVRVVAELVEVLGAAS